MEGEDDVKVQRNPIVAVVVGLAVMLAVASLFQVTGAASVQDGGPCPASWFPLSTQPLSIQEKCIQLRQQRIVDDLATAQARPRTNAPPPTPDPPFPSPRLDYI